MPKHPSHKTRFSDASTFDEICELCGATDEVPGGWGKLAGPCPKAETMPKRARDHFPIQNEPSQPGLLKEIRARFNQPVLTDFSIGRIVGYAEDSCDCYIIIQYTRPTPYRERVYHTMVGGYYWLDRLKGQNLVISNSGEEWDDYYRIDNMLELNGAPKEKEFLIDIDKWNDSLYNDDSESE